MVIITLLPGLLFACSAEIMMAQEVSGDPLLSAEGMLSTPPDM
jgi:hypothetical protein